MTGQAAKTGLGDTVRRPGRPLTLGIAFIMAPGSFESLVQRQRQRDKRPVQFEGQNIEPSKAVKCEVRSNVFRCAKRLLR